MFRRFSFSLLLVLSLLQCLAPLLHAHYSGVSLVTGIHLDGLPEAENGLANTFSGDREYVQAPDSPAVDFANGFVEAGPIAIVFSGLGFLWPALLAAVFPVFTLAPARTGEPCRIPPPQAPPLSLS